MSLKALCRSVDTNPMEGLVLFLAVVETDSTAYRTGQIFVVGLTK
jgi:hypothetical protein